MFLCAATAQVSEFDGRTCVLEDTEATNGGPLIIALNGINGSGPQLLRPANLGPMATGETIAYPTAPDGIWNDG